jgi:hypothetical protein
VNFQGSRPFLHRGPDPLFTLFSSYLVTFAVIVRFDWSKYQNVSTADDESIGGIGFGDRSVCGRSQAYLRENRGLLVLFVPGLNGINSTIGLYNSTILQSQIGLYNYNFFN